MDEKFIESLVNREHMVLGRKLKPFCLYYKALLEYIDSPLLSGKQFAAIDLEVAIRICTCDFGDFPSLKVNPVRLFLRFAGRNVKKGIVKFNEYIEDYYAPPDLWIDERPSAKGVPPETLATAVSCLDMGLYGGDEERIWMMPIGLAKWYAMAHRWDKGDKVDFMDDHSRAIQEDLRRRGYGKKATSDN